MTNLADSMVLAVVGMAVVFAFLAILVGLISLIGATISRLAPPVLEDTNEDVAAIAAALAAYFTHYQRGIGGKD